MNTYTVIEPVLSMTSYTDDLPEYFYTENYNDIRRIHVQLIAQAMLSYPTFAALEIDEQNTCIRRIERGCFNHATTVATNENIQCSWHEPLFTTIYNMITYKIQSNLTWDEKEPMTEYLIKKITDGDICVKNIGSMESKELCPETTQAIYDEIEKRKQLSVPKKYIYIHECSKCHGRKTTEVELQLRSLDEGSTLIVTCEMDNCSNVWRISG